MSSLSAVCLLLHFCTWTFADCTEKDKSYHRSPEEKQDVPESDKKQYSEDGRTFCIPPRPEYQLEKLFHYQSYGKNLTRNNASSSPKSLQCSVCQQVVTNFCSGLNVMTLGGNTRGVDTLQRAVVMLGEAITNVTSEGGEKLNITAKEQLNCVFQMTNIFEDFVFNYLVSRVLRFDNVSLVSDNLDFQVFQVWWQRSLINTKHVHSIRFLGGNSIKIPVKTFRKGRSYILAMIYKDLNESFMTDTSKPECRYQKSREIMINTMIMSVTVYPRPKKLERNISLLFKSIKPPGNKRECVFWDLSENSSNGWSSEGCYTHFTPGSSETTCLCNHMTHFAVLMDFTGAGSGAGSTPQLPPNEIAILNILTYIGLALSLLGSVITIICYLFLTEKEAPLSQIRVSLLASLSAGQIMFLAGIDATKNKGACVAVAALMQYFFMAALCWMLVEGIYLYLFVVKVYNVNHKMSVYHGMSWGIPAVLVAMSLGIASGTDGIGSFVNDEYCWLSSDNGLIWMFVSFLVVIEIVNVVILVLVIREMASMQHTKDKQIEQIRFGIRACVVLIPLLGVTWLFGLLSPLHKAFIYIFVILNSTQGCLIFVLHCARNGEIRARFKRNLQVRLGVSTDFSKSQFRRTSQAGTKSVVNEEDGQDVIELQQT